MLTLQLTTCCRRVSTSYISLIYCTHCVHCSTTCCFPRCNACFSSTRRLLFLYTTLALPLHNTCFSSTQCLLASHNFLSSMWLMPACIYTDTTWFPLMVMRASFNIYFMAIEWMLFLYIISYHIIIIQVHHVQLHTRANCPMQHYTMNQNKTSRMIRLS